MFARTCLYAAAMAAIALSPQYVCSQGRVVKIGALRCNADAGSDLTVASQKRLRCIFAGPEDYRERYSGTIGTLGADLHGRDGTLFLWNVFAPTNGPRRGALAGS